MTDRRSCWALTAVLGAAIVGMTACGASAAGSPGSATGTLAPVVALGPMPTQPTTSPLAVSSVVQTTVSTTAPTTGSTIRPTTTSAGSSSSAATNTPTTTRAAPTKTLCTDVAYIGDSISLGMVSGTTPQRPTAQFETRMAAIGVTDLQVEVSGGRSIVETLPGQENAVTVANRLRDNGFVGCWVIAVGTNDAANIAAGAARQADERVAAIMSVVGRDPVLWIDAASSATSGFWSTPNIEAWDRVLAASAASHPNVRIAPWSKFVRPEWFESDGVHITAAGAAGRTQFVADALVADFPAA